MADCKWKSKAYVVFLKKKPKECERVCKGTRSSRLVRKPPEAGGREPRGVRGHGLADASAGAAQTGPGSALPVVTGALCLVRHAEP